MKKTFIAKAANVLDTKRTSETMEYSFSCLQIQSNKAAAADAKASLDYRISEFKKYSTEEIIEKEIKSFTGCTTYRNMVMTRENAMICVEENLKIRKDKMEKAQIKYDTIIKSGLDFVRDSSFHKDYDLALKGAAKLEKYAKQNDARVEIVEVFEL